MAVPTTRAQFKQYCLRKLGKPVIEINVDDDQVEDRIDEALKYYMDYHYDGTEKVYYAHVLTPTDRVNKYITLPDNIIGAINIFDVGTYYGIHNMFNIRYQIALNDLYTLTNQSMAPYYMAMEHLQFLEQILIGKVPVRYNRHVNRLSLDMDWNKVKDGDTILVEAYKVVDPEVFPDVWGDRWLANYATCLIQEQWGRHLTKFVGVQMAGGLQYNGQAILQQALDKREKMEEEMLSGFSLPVVDMIG